MNNLLKSEIEEIELREKLRKMKDDIKYIVVLLSFSIFMMFMTVLFMWRMT